MIIVGVYGGYLYWRLTKTSDFVVYGVLRQGRLNTFMAYGPSTLVKVLLLKP